MDCWTVLQLTDDADERTIKRAYARLLKSCRPDDDAEGFQRLREAYEHALSDARWRADNEEEQSASAPVLEQAYGNLNDLAELMDIRPLSPAPFETPKPDPAQALVTGLNVHNLDERWAQAQQQQCADAFQAGLLRHCFEAPGERGAITRWAVQHLEWLTPWQRVAMTPWQHEALTGELLQEYRHTLQDLLEQKAEREFVTQLTHYNEQAWLRVFDQQQQWQRIILQLLHDTQWSVPLFERVCQAFGWDDQKGVYPEPAWMWRGLVSRCEQESFYASLQDKAQDTRRTSADALAARLLLIPMTATQQMRIIERFGQNEWNACQHLGDTLTWRYPQLIERLPQSDLFFWRKFVPRPIYTQLLIRLWAIFALAVGLNLAHDQTEKLDFGVVLIFLVLAIVPAAIGFRITQMWAGMSSSFMVADVWLSQYLIPKRLNPNQYWLVLRHGIPQLAMLVACGLMLGILGAVTYAGTLLINLLHTKRIGHLGDKSLAYPWLNGLHWAFWSPLQAVFLVVMVAVIIVAQHYLPAVPWTHIDLPKR
ncbi:DnaJ domain-containing protein [Pseudomonas costantinii]|uniref:J domain-containing protein n=1 Tax=Pseudomonas costantinii TaxID=168469 RepID=UPI0015A461BF|nr:J domain-containing protein [Pseudomonas costantinii]NVZ19609.1 DnaJ domain-containing protein [Pseudomonas costantinii]